MYVCGRFNFRYTVFKIKSRFANVSKQRTGCSQEKLSVQIRLLICFNSHQLASRSIHNKLFMRNSSTGKQMNINILLAPIYVSLLPCYVQFNCPCFICKIISSDFPCQLVSWSLMLTDFCYALLPLLNQTFLELSNASSSAFQEYSLT